jgi:gas vesicle structural protein
MVSQSNHGHSIADDVGTDPLLRRGTSMTYDMTPPQQRGSSYVRRAPNSAGLYDVLDLILDKGIVVDAFVRVSLVGIEILTIDLRVVIASVDTYLRYAEGAERLHLYRPRGGEEQLPDMLGMDKKSGGLGGMALRHGAKKLKGAITGGDEGDDKGDDDDEGEEKEGIGGRLADGVRNVLTRGVGRVLEHVSGHERAASGDPPSRHDRDRNRDRDRGRNGKHDRGHHDKVARRARAGAGDR